MTSFSNQATLSYLGNIINSNIASGQLLDVLAISKNSLSTGYGPDDNVPYIISIVNSDTKAYDNLTVTDNLGSYSFNGKTLTPLSYVDGTVRYYVNGVLQEAPKVTAGPPLVFSGIQVPAQGNAMLMYEASTNSYAPPGVGSSLNNEATLTGDGVSSPIQAAATLAAATKPDLTISKSLSPQTVTGNEEITYTFMIANYGNTEADAMDQVAIQDTFNPVLKLNSVTFNGTTWTSPSQYTYNATTGDFSTVAGKITVPAATYSQDATTGAWAITPGVSTLIGTGTI